jgi:hypothetical protein
MVGGPVRVLGDLPSRSPCHSLLPGSQCHGRVCPGHPRLWLSQHRQSWMAGSRPAMTRRPGGRRCQAGITFAGPNAETLGPATETLDQDTGTSMPGHWPQRLPRSIPQRAVYRSAGLFCRSPGRAERVLNLFAGTIQAAAGPFGGSFLVARGQAHQHHGAAGNHQQFTHKHLSIEQNPRNDCVWDRLHRVGCDRLVTACR